jgi:hypothetical protein
MRLEVTDKYYVLYLKGHTWPRYHDYVGHAGYDRLNDTSKLA